MMRKIVKLFTMALLVFFISLAILFPANTSVFASEINKNINYDNIYKEVATNFFISQYKEKNINYNSLDVAIETNMYNNNDEIIGKVVVLKRDEQYDYVVLNTITSQIDEFAFDDSLAIQKFSENIYYTGVLEYYKKEKNSYKHIENNNIISKNDFKIKSNKINKELKKHKNELSKNDKNPLPTENKTGWNGFYDWSNIRNFNHNNGYSTNSDWGYLNGINWNGIYDENLKFYNQNTFNNYFSTNNACGPTALTNMFSWFEFMQIKNSNGEVNALKNDSVFDTFARFKQLVNHSNTNGTSRDKYNSALKDYAKEQGYDYKIDTGIDTFDEFKKNIDANMPVLTSIDLDSWGGHAIVVVGYEEFKQSYEQEHTILWFNWTTTEYRYSKYLRVIDGWSTSNSSRFIDMAGYWDTVSGRGFKIQ